MDTTNQQDATARDLRAVRACLNDTLRELHHTQAEVNHLRRVLGLPPLTHHHPH